MNVLCGTDTLHQASAATVSATFFHTASANARLLCSYPREDSVHESHYSSFSRPIAADVGHVNNQTSGVAS